MKKIISKILFAAGALLGVAWPVISTGDGMTGSMLFGAFIPGEGADDLFGQLGVGLFEDHSLIGAALLLWLPLLLFTAATVVVFIGRYPKRTFTGVIIAAPAIVLTLVTDVLIILNDGIYAGIFMNMAGMVLIIVAAVLILLAPAETEDTVLQEGETCGIIRCTRGEYRGGEFEIYDQMIIGKDPKKCNIVLSNRTVSGLHCIIRYIPETDTYTVEDRSTNGTCYLAQDGKVSRELKMVKDYEMQFPRGTEIYMGKPVEAFVLD